VPCQLLLPHIDDIKDVIGGVDRRLSDEDLLWSGEEFSVVL